MKKIFTYLLFFIYSVAGIPQTPVATYEMITNNFRQTDETTIEWELWIKKTSGEDFGLFTFQAQWQISSTVLNSGGQFLTEYFFIEPGADAVFMPHYSNSQATVTDRFNFTPNVFPDAPGTEMTLINSNPKHIATFRAQLRKNGNPHNFADVSPQFAFRLNGIFEVFAAQTPYVNNSEGQLTGTQTPTPGTPLNTRQLAGYWFTGEGNWSETARWNNITNENKNVVPPLSTNNVGIAGQATVTNARTVNQLAVALDGLLVLSGDADNTGHLTVNGNLFNDNQTDGAKKGTVTIAAWDLEDTGQMGLPYLADDGIVGNIGAAEFNISHAASFEAFYDLSEHSIVGGTRAPFALNWRVGPAGGTPRDWRISISTEGFKNLKISSKQWSDINNEWGAGVGPNEFILQWSTDEFTWNNVQAGNVTVANDWTSGVLFELALPSDIENEPNVFIRWLNNTSGLQGYSSIDDIIIIGEELPPPPTGLLIASTAAGTGSLIHNTADVEATIERYIPETGYHLVSVPFTQDSDPRSGWFIWSYLYEYAVESQTWESMSNATWTPLNVNQGYMVYKYPGPDKWSSDTTYAMTGLMNSGSFVCAVSGDAQDHNLVPNPFPSAIDWKASDGWAKANLYDAIWIWNELAEEPYGPEYVGNYAAFVNNMGANGGSRHIPVGQAFFIQASGASAGLTMNNNVRVHNDQPFFKDAEEQLNVLRIKAKSNNYRDEMVVYFDGEASTAFDGQFDASKMFGLPEAPQIYSVSTDNRNLTINGMPFTNEVISVPVGFSLNTAGEVTFETSSIESFDPEVTIFLWDMLTNTMTNLRENQQYNFVHNPDNDPVRFALLFNSAVGIAESATNPVRLYAVDNKLYLHIPEEIDEDFLVQLFDTGGRMIFSTTASTGSTIINVPSLGAGIYVVQLVSDRHSVVKKVFMK